MDTRHNGFCRSEPTVKISILWPRILRLRPQYPEDPKKKMTRSTVPAVLNSACSSAYCAYSTKLVLQCLQCQISSRPTASILQRV